MHYGIASYAQPLSDTEVLKRFGYLVRRGALALGNRTGVDADQLWQAGAAGLIEGVRKFDNELGVTLQEFLSGRIRRAMLDAISKIPGSATVDVGDKLLEPLLLSKEKAPELKSALSALPEKQQAVLSLRYVEEFSLKEIVGVLGVSDAHVRELHNDAVVKLKQLL